MNKTQEVCTDDPKAHSGWVYKGGENISFGYYHDRTLYKWQVKKAMAKIEKEVSGFPFQLRYSMARPLWERYCDEYCRTGDHEKALGAI